MTIPHRTCSIPSIVASAALLVGACRSSEVTDPPPQYAASFVVVVVDPATPATDQLAVQACAGLANQRSGGSVYVRTEAEDDAWLSDLGFAPSETVDASTFLASCTMLFPKCVRYAYATQQRLLPSILTVAAALGAVPIDEDQDVACRDVVFDAGERFDADETPESATRYVFERYIDRTTGLAMLNPGYEIESEMVPNPAITRDMPGAMVDFVFSRRLFTTFLVNGCINGNTERIVLSDVVNSGQWETPLGVYGYNNSWLIGGFLWEAQTTCLGSRNMGAIPTETGNLSFFSTRRPPITNGDGLARTPPQNITYDPSKTYVAFVVGDGDNIRFVMTTRKAWLRERIDNCASSPATCAPLTWSLSPHLAELAPDVLEWYFATSEGTGQDYFILPPSGHLYAYPTDLNEADQDRFVTLTERDARILGTRSVVHWDQNTTWTAAQTTFLPKYARADGVIQGIVAVNVPYLIEAFPEWDPTEYHRVLTGNDGTPLVVFRPRAWRGVNDIDANFFVSPQNMANELAAYPPGTVRVIYMTSDGGLSLDNSFTALIPLLPENVEVVSADAAASLALAASGM